MSCPNTLRLYILAQRRQVTLETPLACAWLSQCSSSPCSQPSTELPLAGCSGMRGEHSHGGPLGCGADRGVFVLFQGHSSLSPTSTWQCSVRCLCAPHLWKPLPPLHSHLPTSGLTPAAPLSANPPDVAMAPQEFFLTSCNNPTLWQPDQKPPFMRLGGPKPLGSRSLPSQA